MTATKNKTVSSETRNKAAQKATSTGEHTVVYETVIGKKSHQLLTTLSIWGKAEYNPEVTFIAVIDSNGNFVD